MPGFALLGFSAPIFLSLLPSSLVFVCLDVFLPNTHCWFLNPALFCSGHDEGKSYSIGQPTCVFT